MHASDALTSSNRVARSSIEITLERRLTMLFSAAILVSSWLLFLVQPMFAKMVLPRLGGTPAVWNTCVVFFQAMLLAGYLYAHLTTRWLGVRRQARLHLGVVLLPLVVLPISVIGEMPPTSGTPVWWLLGVLLLSVGLPFFVVSTTSPLLQCWFSTMPHSAAKNPYFLYSSSNFASMLALVSYPVIIEPSLRLADQSSIWTWAYVLFALLIGACAVSVRWWARPALVDVVDESFTSASAPTWRDRLGWLVLSFVPSSLMLGVTTHISTDIAAVPLMWVVPLALYLATFMLVFARRSLLPARGLTRILPFLATPTLVTLAFANNPWWLIPLHLVTFFVGTSVCHLRLAAARPAPRHLTDFYLWMSAGGVLGGLFNTLAAPLLFTGVLEYPLVLAMACALRPSPAFRRGSLESWPVVLLPLPVLGLCVVLSAAGLFGTLSILEIVGLVGLIWLIGVSFSNRPQLYGVITAALVVTSVVVPIRRDHEVLFAARSFFGVHRVVQDADFHRLQHGGTMHGLQRRDSMEACEPNSYYHRTGPLGQLFEVIGGGFERVAVIGLGSGGAACYGRAGQHWTFFEIDSTVERIARDRRLFTHLAATPASVDVKLGDGRLLLAQSSQETFDLLVMDAFSSDAIPLHLVTREAIELAFSRLRPDGVLVFHISNRYLDLEPVLGAIARDMELQAKVNFDTNVTPNQRRTGKQASHWVVMTRSVPAMGRLASDARWRAIENAAIRAWTDDFSNILSIFQWSTGAAARP